MSKVILWVFVALCLLAFTARIYIRLKCFRKLLLEDWFMVAAVACHLALAIVGQLFLVDLYAVLAAQHGAPIGPDFYTITSARGLHAFGVICILSLAGIWLIKLNFLFFFYRLGHHIRAYRIFWGFAFIFCISCGATCFGLIQYKCMFGDLETRNVICTTVSSSQEACIIVIMTAVIDILSDCTSKSSLPST